MMKEAFHARDLMKTTESEQAKTRRLEPVPRETDRTVAKQRLRKAGNRWRVIR